MKSEKGVFAELATELVVESSADALMLLDRDYRIRGVNAAFEVVALRSRAELLGEVVFDAFPDAPDDPEANGTTQLEKSLEGALRSRGTDSMPIVRYDISNPSAPDMFLPKLWACSNTAVLQGRESAVAVLQRVRPINSLDEALKALTSSFAGGAALGTAEQLYVLTALAAAMRTDRDEIAEENAQLRRALESRDVIGQAKGIIMERYDVDSPRAFTMLVKLSQDSNIRVETVAQRLIDLDHPAR